MRRTRHPTLLAPRGALRGARHAAVRGIRAVWFRPVTPRLRVLTRAARCSATQLLGGSLLAMLLLVACDERAEGPPAPQAAERDGDSSVVARTFVGQTTVMELPDGASLTVPDGALPDRTVIRVRVVRAPDYPALPPEGTGYLTLWAFEIAGETLLPLILTVPMPAGDWFLAQLRDDGWERVPFTVRDSALVAEVTSPERVGLIRANLDVLRSQAAAAFDAALDRLRDVHPDVACATADATGTRDDVAASTLLSGCAETTGDETVLVARNTRHFWLDIHSDDETTGYTIEGDGFAGSCCGGSVVPPGGTTRWTGDFSADFTLRATMSSAAASYQLAAFVLAALPGGAELLSTSPAVLHEAVALVEGDAAVHGALQRIDQDGYASGVANVADVFAEGSTQLTSFTAAVAASEIPGALGWHLTPRTLTSLLSRARIAEGFETILAVLATAGAADALSVGAVASSRDAAPTATGPGPGDGAAPTLGPYRSCAPVIQLQILRSSVEVGFTGTLDAPLEITIAYVIADATWGAGTWTALGTVQTGETQIETRSTRLTRATGAHRLVADADGGSGPVTVHAVDAVIRLHTSGGIAGDARTLDGAVLCRGALAAE